MSGSGKSSSHFTLTNIDTDLQIKREKASAGPSKGRTPNLRPKSKKRKSTDLIDVDDSPFCFQTVANHCSQSLQQMVNMYVEGHEVIEGMKKMAAAHNVVMNREATEMANLNKELHDLKNEAATTRMNHRKEMEEFSANVQKDVVIAVFKSRILFANHAMEKGFDTSIWDFELWKDKLALLTSDVVETQIKVGSGPGMAIIPMEDEATEVLVWATKIIWSRLSFPFAYFLIF